MALNFIVVTVVHCLLWYFFTFSTYKVGLLEIYFTSTFAYFFVFISFSYPDVLTMTYSTVSNRGSESKHSSQFTKFRRETFNISFLRLILTLYFS